MNMRVFFENTPENGVILRALEKLAPAGSLSIRQVVEVCTENEDLGVLVKELGGRVTVNLGEPQTLTKEQVQEAWKLEEKMAEEPAKDAAASFVITNPKFPGNGNGHKPEKSKISKGRQKKVAPAGETDKKARKAEYMKQYWEKKKAAAAAAQEAPADPASPLSGQAEGRSSTIGE